MLSVSGQEQIEEKCNQRSCGGTTNSLKIALLILHITLSVCGPLWKSYPRQHQLGALQAESFFPSADPTSLPISGM